jgi:hypothetical protein
MTAAYWEIGRRIVHSEQQAESRAEYGQQLIAQLANDLTREFGRGFGDANLWKIRAFYLVWPESRILSTALRESLSSSIFSQMHDYTSTISTLPSRFTLPLVGLSSSAFGQKPRSAELL